MDKLAKQLRADAERIDATVSADLDRRIDASLRAVTPEPEARRPAPIARPPLFWWASTLTGIAAAIAVIAIVNLRTPEQQEPTPVDLVATVPPLDLKAETAMLTAPLHEELDRLQSDFKKAEEKVKQDIGF